MRLSMFDKDNITDFFEMKKAVRERERSTSVIKPVFLTRSSTFISGKFKT